jgi:predicted ABC-type ATPase
VRFDLEQRPIIVAVAGPNGAGKSTFYYAHLHPAGLRFVNADQLAAKTGADAMRAAEIAQVIRRRLVLARESFVFETVFSDPVGDKLGFLLDAVAQGYQVFMCFIGISGPERCEERVLMRVSQGGHDVPTDKIVARYTRVLRNLRLACAQLPAINIYDNDDLGRPFRLVAEVRAGQVVRLKKPVPQWLTGAIAGAQ